MAWKEKGKTMFDRVEVIETCFNKAREAILPFVAGCNVLQMELALEQQKISCYEMLREQQEKEDGKIYG